MIKKNEERESDEGENKKKKLWKMMKENNII